MSESEARGGVDEAALQDAAAALARGELVAFATETVYGLGANADDPAAVARVYAQKGRPADHPLIVHVADVAAAQGFAATWPPEAQRLADAFWPGPLTLILPRAVARAEAAAGGQPTIGLRCPAHPLAQALLATAQHHGVVGIAAPSANRFGRISPTLAAHVREEFGPGLRVLDGGPCSQGIESAIVDLSGAQPALLRPGTLSRAQLDAALGASACLAAVPTATKAPGMLAAHYAPRARLVLKATAELVHALQGGADNLPSGTALYCRLAWPQGARRRRMPDDPGRAAHELFAVLRDLDAGGADCIWVEQPPPEAAWDGVRDRLQRAAASTPDRPPREGGKK